MDRYNAAFLAACCTHLHLPPSLLPLVQGLAASVAASIYTQGIDTISCRSWMTRWSGEGRRGERQTSRPVVPIKCTVLTSALLTGSRISIDEGESIDPRPSSFFSSFPLSPRFQFQLSAVEGLTPCTALGALVASRCR